MAQDQPLKTYGAYDKEIAIFSSVMRWKLEKNAHKGRWEDIGPERALELLDAEVQELKQAVQNRRMWGAGTPDVLLEAADVANQALILAMVMINPPVETAEAKDQPDRKTTTYTGYDSPKTKSKREYGLVVGGTHPETGMSYSVTEVYDDKTINPDGSISPPQVKTGLHPAFIGLKDV